jgi:hypothetical protein
VLEIHKRIVWPELLLQFFPRHHLARLFEQDRQDLERLA